MIVMKAGAIEEVIKTEYPTAMGSLHETALIAADDVTFSGWVKMKLKCLN